MEQYRDSQYDDDLTVGMEEKEDLFDTGFVDLFEYSGDDESPIARLKTIVLSIDWEINDQVLTQFNEELIDLKDIWGDDPIKLVYIQALEKIGKYIYQQKSNAHPNAIKLLLGFYYNLEKIVLNLDLTEEEKKEILREDVRKFDQLKQQIGSTSEEYRGSEKETVSSVAPSATINEQGGSPPLLFNLKACILGMDWEITERELSDLSREIKILEEEFAGSKPKMLFLQGIGALGGYIKLKKSNAHADAFKLLYSFYEGLEEVVEKDLPLEEEKKVLLPQVEKFEAFKKTIASTITPGMIYAEDQDHDDDGVYDDSIAPAFADVPEDSVGFQAEDEKGALEDDTVPRDMEGRLDSFFSDEAEKKDEPVTAAVPGEALPKEAQERIDSFFSSEKEADDLVVSISAEDALRGVDVETEADDDSDEDALPLQGDGALAPALAESDAEDEHGFNPDLTGGDSEESKGEIVSEVEESVGGLLEESIEEPGDAEPSAALAGVAVETEADDDSGEAPLPKIDDEIAPALFGDDEEEAFAETEEETEISGQIAGFFDDEETPDAETAAPGEQSREDIESRLDSFFGEDVEEVSDIAEDEDDEAEVAGELEDEIDSFFSEDDERQDLFRAVPEGEEQFAASIDETAERERQELATELEADDSAVFSLSDEDEDEFAFEPGEEKHEEITFEPADEEDDEAAGELPVAVLEGDESAVDDDLSSFGSGSDEQDFFAAIDERVDEPGEFQMEILDETEEFEGPAVAVEPDADSLDEDLEEEQVVADEEGDVEEEEEPFTFSSDDSLANLRDGIASLGVEINESIVDGILVEINRLRQRLTAKPIEKTFLQLISTIVQHIGQYGYEASAEAHGLLLSVFDKLELVENPDIQTDQAQEILLAETCKVLLWQQRMLDRQAVRKGDQLTFIDPVRTDGTASEADADESVALTHEPDEQTMSEVAVAEENDFSAVFEPVEEDEDETGMEAGDDAETIQLADDVMDDDITESTDELQLQEDDLFKELDADEDLEMLSEDEELFDDSLMEDETLIADEDSGEIEPSEESTEQDPQIAHFVKQEIEALRQSLKQEIEELKKQLKNR